MSRLIVAFESEVTRQRVCELFAASSFPVRASCRTGAEVIRAAHFMGGAVVVCGVKLADCTADQLYSDLEGLACMLVVAKPEQLEMCENPHIFRLPLPVNRHDLTASVRMLEQLAEMEQARPQQNAADQELIRQAKIYLQEVRLMTEEEAHRYLQKRSMTTRRKMAEVAAEIIDRQRG